MRDNSYDRTIERNYLQKWRFLIPEYEAVKAAGRSCSSGLGISTVTTEPARRRSGSITTAICRAGRKRTCCRAGAGPNGGNGANRKGSRRRSSPTASEG